MKEFQIHFKNGKKEIKIEMHGMESLKELEVISDLVKSLNINMRNHSNFLDEDHIENCSVSSFKKIEEGYKTLQTTKKETKEVLPEKPVIEEAFYRNKPTIFSEALLNAQVVNRNEDWFDIQKYTTEYNVKFFDNQPHYQVYYICPNCGDKGKRYIKRDTTTVNCHKCTHTMFARDAHVEGFPKTDPFDNFLSLENTIFP